MTRTMLELFSGSGQMALTFKSHGWKTYTVDYNADLEPDYCLNVYDILDKEKIKFLCGGVFPDVIWISPDCTTYSIAAGGTHRWKDWNTELKPKTDYAKYCDENNTKLMDFVRTLDNNTLFFIENPRGYMRKMPFMHHIPRYTVTYCQYGFEYQKPTDIWTNHPNPNFKPPCKRNSPCHISAPRGSKNGINGLGIKGMRNICKNDRAYQRSLIPYQLCEHIYTISQNYFDEKENGDNNASQI